ncbi:hypothetical protein R1sor_017778 [Riccia sorocarpa]|uniref:Phthiocerol/phthiodiolone dimycocerosyl transferase C-terminal domain-containing protein n=1 Tax=Riccia sorocarpa TaxID=122646 RepID=A0ABD3I8A2_9MARC
MSPRFPEVLSRVILCDWISPTDLAVTDHLRLGSALRRFSRLSETRDVLSFHWLSYCLFTRNTDRAIHRGRSMTVPTVALTPDELMVASESYPAATKTEVNGDGIDNAAAVEERDEMVQEKLLDEEDETVHSRTLGDTEHNWCRAVESGTGITVLAVFFSRRLEISALQAAVEVLQLKHPRLRSQLIWVDGKPAFRVSPGPFVKIEVLDAAIQGVERNAVEEMLEGEEEQSLGEMQDAEEHEWMVHVENELNTNIWSEQHSHCLVPQQLLVVRLRILPNNYSLLTMRVHTAVCDRISGATLLVDLLKALRGTSSIGDDNNVGLEDDAEMSSNNLVAIEDAIPPGQANKPFWAHGIDLIGYSLGSRRHALLPFANPDEPRRSKFIHSVLSVEQTQSLLDACIRADTSVYGAICAAGLKAAAILKQMATKSEHYALITLIDCREYLEPKLSQSTVGFYHSALMNTHHVNEITDFWELARRCSSSLDNAMKNRKHFTDMGDLNFLMFQAISHPALTPSSSMRTSQLVLFRDPALVQVEDLAQEMGVEHYVGCSSIHGVGPALAIFDSIRKGALHFTGVYPSPLYSRRQMRSYVNAMLNLLVHSSQN